MPSTYLSPANTPTRPEIEALAGALLLEFGAASCGHCQAAGPLVAAALQRHPGLRLLRIEDGPGRALGRSYRVKLWPTLVLLHQGQELARLVRPRLAAELAAVLALLPPSARPGAEPGAETGPASGFTPP